MNITYKSTDTIRIAGSSLAVNTTQYADHDLIGALQSIQSPFGSGVGFIITSITLQDTVATNLAGMQVLIFEQYPSGSTFTNNSALALVDADVPRVAHKVEVATTDWDAIGSSCAIAEVFPLSLSVKPEPSGYFYLAIMADTQTPTFETSGLSLTLGCIADPT